jgi:hypothetical protein
MAIITPNKEFLQLAYSKDGLLDIWNLKSRVKQASLNYKVSWQMIACSTDSKYLYMSCEDGCVVQFNTTEMAVEARFQLEGTMS